MELFEYILQFLIKAITGVITFISRTKSHLECSMFGILKYTICFQ